MTTINQPSELTGEQRERLDRLSARRPGRAGGSHSGPARTPRRHPAKGARRAALALSLATTGALTAFFHAGRVATLAAGGTGTPAAAVVAAADSTVTGDPIFTRFGPVQVRAVFAADGSLAGVDAVLAPDGDGRSLRINRVAVPALNQEALSSQSAQVDIVSGATFTSVGYARSLQSAIDAANDQGITLLT